MRKFLPYIGVLCLLIAGFIYSSSNEPRESLKNLSISSSVPTTTVAPFVKPDNWETYEDSSYNYVISFPSDFQVKQNGDASIQILREQPPMGVGPTNFAYISVVTPNKINVTDAIYNYNFEDYQKLEELRVSELVSLSNDNQLKDFFTYRRYPDKKLGEITAKQFVNEKPWEFPEGTKETRLIFTKDNRIFLVGVYIKADDLPEHKLSSELFNQIVATLTFK
jgi:hypothetical protein